MSKKPWLVAMLACGVLAGCDRSQTASSSPPATQPVAAATTSPSIEQIAVVDTTPPKQTPATAPATSSFLVRDGITDHLYDFPRAILRLTRHEGDKYEAVLYSDDPQAALNPGYSGNSFYLQMKLDMDDPHKLVNVPWAYRAVSNDHEEAGDGIFLEGNHIHLQPSEVMANLDGSGTQVKVIIVGKFLKFDNSSENNHLPPLVGVRGEFTATIEVK